MEGYLYAVKDKNSLCKNHDYKTLTLGGKSLYSDETVDDLINQGHEIFDSKSFGTLWQECWDVYENEICGQWKEISSEQYNDMLNCLPPMKWTNGGFFLSELYSGNIGYFFQEWFGKYYESMQNITKPRQDITNRLSVCIQNGSVLPLVAE